MSKVRKWMMEERGDCVEKVDMPDKAIKLFGKTISLSVYLNPNIEQNTEKAMDATCPTDSRFGCDPIYIQEQAQFPPSSQEDENLPSLADEARSSASSNSGCDEDKQGDSVAADNPLAALEVTEAKPDGSVEVSEKTKSDQDPPSSGVSVEKARRRPNKAVPCPRCESMDTKFCYYNNYNLSQPRHFCKNCQRYWTAGGSLRNVPVGAGRRRNKHAPAQQWHMLRADPMEAAQPLISCAFPQTVNIPLDLDLLRTAPKIGLPSIIKHDTCSLLSNSSESIVSNINQKDCSGQPCVASGQELQKSDYSRGQKTSLKDDVGCYGWPGASPVSPLNGPWPLLYNMRWIHSPLQAAGATVSPLPALIDTNAGSASQACPSVPSGWTSAFSTSLGAAAAAAMAAAAVANVKSMGDMQVLGKHPRTESCKEGEKTKSLWAPKTQRLTGPGEEARSSIMAILAAAKKPESITSGSMFKVFQSKQASQPDKHPAISTPLQESN